MHEISYCHPVLQIQPLCSPAFQRDSKFNMEAYSFLVSSTSNLQAHLRKIHGSLLLQKPGLLIIPCTGHAASGHWGCVQGVFYLECCLYSFNVGNSSSSFKTQSCVTSWTKPSLTPFQACLFLSHHVFIHSFIHEYSLSQTYEKYCTWR